MHQSPKALSILAWRAFQEMEWVTCISRMMHMIGCVFER